MRPILMIQSLKIFFMMAFSRSIGIIILAVQKAHANDEALEAVIT